MNLLSNIRNRALHRALAQYLSVKKAGNLPDLQRVNSVLIVLDGSDKSIVKNIENSVKALFGATRCGFLVLCNQMSDNVLQSDLYNEITPKDFGFLRVLKPEKLDYLKKMSSCNLMVNMTAKNDDISDYICTLPKSDFRVCFSQSKNMQVYDLIIENPKATDPVSNIHVLHNYLKALSGPQTWGTWDGGQEAE